MNENKIKAIIVDDEPNARVVLKQLILKDQINIEIVSECECLTDAVSAIKTHKPDVVFLDVQMPKYAGYEIVDFINPIDFQIVFVTAFDNYAIKAFEVNAMDYILKPIERNRLSQTIKKIALHIEKKRKQEEYQLLAESFRNNQISKIIIPEIGDRRIVDTNSIIAIEAQSSYSRFFLSDSTEFIASKTLKYFDNILEGDKRFTRTHRAYVVNLDYIISINKKDYSIHLENGVVAKVSRNRMDIFDAKSINYLKN